MTRMDEMKNKAELDLGAYVAELNAAVEAISQIVAHILFAVDLDPRDTSSRHAFLVRLLDRLKKHRDRLIPVPNEAEVEEAIATAARLMVNPIGGVSFIGITVLALMDEKLASRLLNVGIEIGRLLIERFDELEAMQEWRERVKESGSLLTIEELRELLAYEAVDDE